MKITKNQIEAVKTIPILSIVKKLGIKVNQNNKAICPFSDHRDKLPSFTIYPKTNTFYCFGCGVGGNPITFIQKILGYSFVDAINWLLHEFNMSKISYVTRDKIKKTAEMQENQEQQIETNIEIYEELVSRCHLSNTGRNYLKGRGLATETINRFQIKDNTNIREIGNHLRDKYGEMKLVNSGIFVKRQGVYRIIWWDQTILIPFFKNGRVVYIQGRRIRGNPPKYVNLKGINKPIFNHDILLSLSTGATLCICEGVMDTIATTQIGYSAVGVLGATSFKKEWVDMLNDYRIIVIPHGDNAGEKFEQSVRKAFVSKGHIIESLKLSKDRDVADLLKESSK